MQMCLLGLEGIHLGVDPHVESIQIGLLLAVKARLRAMPSQMRLSLPGKVTESFTPSDVSI